MISQTAEYALRAAVYLAGTRDEPRTTRVISNNTRVPSTYLSKILGFLHRADLVRSERGRHGGFRLTRAPEEISALDVINAVDPLKRLDHCPLGNPDHAGALCPLHARLAQSMSMIEDTFRQSMLSDLLVDTAAGPKACGFPSEPRKEERR